MDVVSSIDAGQKARTVVGIKKRNYKKDNCIGSINGLIIINMFFTNG